MHHTINIASKMPRSFNVQSQGEAKVLEYIQVCGGKGSVGGSFNVQSQGEAKVLEYILVCGGKGSVGGRLPSSDRSTSLR